MRLRTTATALVGALALVLPTAGLSYANDHDDRERLGTLHYRYVDGDGDRTDGRIRPADNDTCYRLTGTSQSRPAYAVKNETESLAVLYRDRSCGGPAQEELEPGERARDLEVRSVYFKPVDDHHGGHDGRHDDEDDNRHDGRSDDDGRYDDDDRSDDDGRYDEDDRRVGGRAAAAPVKKMPDLFDHVFRTIG